VYLNIRGSNGLRVLNVIVGHVVPALRYVLRDAEQGPQFYRDRSRWQADLDLVDQVQIAAVMRRGRGTVRGMAEVALVPPANTARYDLTLTGREGRRTAQEDLRQFVQWFRRFGAVVQKADNTGELLVLQGDVRHGECGGWPSKVERAGSDRTMHNAPTTHLLIAHGSWRDLNVPIRGRENERPSFESRRRSSGSSCSTHPEVFN
jgi:hypothetical protein